MSLLLRQALDRTLTPAPGGASRWQGWTLGAVLAFQLGLSLWLGWPQADSSRWWDERFNVRNIESSLAAGSLRPENGYYGGVSYVPQTVALALVARLSHLTGWQSLAPLTSERTLTPAAYHLIRGSQALVGALAIVWVYALARRLAAAEVALVAAALCAVSPRLIHAGAIFKPDVELLAATLLAILTGWLAASRPPHTGRYVLAGMAIGLAVGAKLNGIIIAGPVALAAALRWRELGRWPRLALAAAVSFATYWLFNPKLDQTLRALSKNREHYVQTASGGWLAVLGETLGYPFRSSFHGPLVAGLAVAGLLVLAAAAARRRGTASSRIGWWMLISYPPIYYAAYIVASPRAKENHFLQVVPFAALYAAVALVAAAHWLLGAARPVRARLAVGLLAAAAIGASAARTFAEVYDITVPTTSDLARAWGEDHLPDPLHGRRLLTLGLDLRGAAPRSPVYQKLQSDNDLGAASADADGILATSASLPERAVSAVLAQRIAPGREASFVPRLFRARGEPVTAVLFPHRVLPHPAAGRIVFHSDAAGQLTATLPAGIEPGTALSLRLRLRLRGPAASELELQVGGKTYPWAAGPASEGDTFFLSPRFEAPPTGELRTSIRSGRLQRRANGELFVWARP